MKRTLLSTLVITSTLGLSANVFALGMGELELKSTLNQPLQAEIELTNIADLTEWEIKPSLASDGDFDRAGVEKIFFLSDIDFEVKGNRIVLSSDKTVTEPFLNFLVQVNWPSGRVLREYTLLLDPPVFDEQIQPLASQQPSQRVEAQAVVAAEVQPANRWESEDAAPGTYKVQPNDTLWEIAINTRPSRQVSPQQMMLAIQDSNPGAFISGNINRLKTHQVLRIPNKQQMAARNDSQAVNEVMRQNRELQSAGAQIDATANAAQTNKAEQLNDGGELKLLSKQNDVAESAGASGDSESGVAGNGRQEDIQNDLAIALESLDTSSLENEDLKSRLSSLEEQIATLQRLVSLKDDQLASIQTLELQKEAQLEEQPITDAVADEAVEVAGIVDEVAEETVVTDEAAEDFNYADDLAETAAEEAAITADIVPATEIAAEVEIDPALAATQIQQQTEDRYKPKGFVAEVMAKPALMGGIAGGIALLLGLIGLALKKRNAAKEGEIEDPELAGFDEDFEFTEGELDESSLDDFEFDENDPAVSAHGELNDDLLEGIGGSEDLDAEVEETETVAQTADIIGEAEIYIAYGRFDQAADLLKNSIDSEPSRIDLRMKLLEVYLETDDADSYAEAELSLNSIGDFEADEKAAAMRSRLSSPISGQDETPTMEDILADETDFSIDMEALADSDDEFSGGIDFEAALDLSDADEFSASLDALDDESEIDLSSDLDSELDLGSEIDLGGELDLDSELDLGSELDVGDDLGLEFSLDAEEDIPTLDDLSGELSLDDIPTLDTDFDDIPVLDSEDDLALLDTAAELEDIPTLEDIPSLEDEVDVSFDLSELSDLAAAEQDEISVDDTIVDLAAMAADESLDDVSALENLLDTEGSIDGLPDLDFDLDETGFEGDSLGDDLEALEAELNDLTTDVAEDVPIIEDFATVEEVPAIEEPAELEGFSEFEENSEFDLNELEDLPDFTTEIAEADVAEEDAAKTSGQEIDLEQLAAADDEFDFLAGTDECATKLDLARAYLDMEDGEGAKELLQEVVAEGSDQQKQDARALIDSIG
ncbi:MAG: FimV/HubP family polar landmark protein [Oleispira sp.]